MTLDYFWIEAVLIVVLILANGFFAASEIAMIAMRKSRIDALLEKGVTAAAAVARLKNDPDRFLATVQIGVTLVSSFASALGGAAAVGYLKPQIAEIPISFVARWADAIALTIVVLPISYLSLVFGELVPKSLALRYSEQIACFVARPIELLARVSAIFVKMLMASSNFVLRLFGGNNNESASFISVDEVKSLIREGTAKGIFNETERELIHSVFEFTDTPVKAVMKPRTEIHAIDASHHSPKSPRISSTAVSRAFRSSKATWIKLSVFSTTKTFLRRCKNAAIFVFAITCIKLFSYRVLCRSANCSSNCNAAAWRWLWWLTNSAKSKASLHWKIWSKRSSARFAMNTTAKNAARWTGCPTDPWSSRETRRCRSG